MDRPPRHCADSAHIGPGTVLPTVGRVHPPLFPVLCRRWDIVYRASRPVLLEVSMALYPVLAIVFGL